MRTFMIGLAGLMTALVASPSFAGVWVEEEEVRLPRPRVVEREVIVRKPAWRTFVSDECRIVVQRRHRPDGTVVIRKVRRC